jgi:hypothetical protein
VAAVGEPVQLLQEPDRLQILPPAEAVRNPLARVPRVIQIQHRRNGVDPQPVDVIFLEPEERVRQQEVAHFVPAVVEDQRAPVAMFALTRIGVFVQRRAVELRQAVSVLREMPRDPVENHPEAGLMAGVDEQLEILGRTETAGRREKSEDLIAPRSGERVFHHRQQLDVSEAHLRHVGHKPVRQLAVRQEAVAVVRHTRPRSEMHLVDRDRVLERALAGVPARHPFLVAPLVPGELVDHGRRRGRHLERHAERIALRQQLAVARADLEFVLLAVRQIGDEQFPDAVRREQPHGVNAAVPAVEVADHADAVGVGGPHGEMDPGRRSDRDAMRAEFLKGAVVGALAEQMQVVIGEHAAVAVGVVEFDDVIVRVGDSQPVVADIGGHDRFEEARRMTPIHCVKLAVRQSDGHRERGGLERADDNAPAGAVGVRPQHGERVAVPAARDSVQSGLGGVGGADGHER